MTNMLKYPSCQNPSVDFAEIWPQLLPGKGCPSPNLGLSLMSGSEEVEKEETK